MFGLGITEILLILAVALLVLGPEKLPETARELGKFVANFRRALDGIKEDIHIDNLGSDGLRGSTPDQIRPKNLTNTKGTCEENENIATKASKTSPTTKTNPSTKTDPNDEN